GKVSYTVIASILVNIIPALRREGVPVDEISEDVLEDVVKALSEGIIAKEAVPDVLSYLSRNPGVNVAKAIEDLGIKKPGVEELDALIVNVINANRDKLLARSDKAFTIVMGEVMKTIRGKIDGKIVAERVKIKLREILNI
ncbi:MAG: Glu-tRNA(Gln) amidotransferase GatDE subunit E, partial [Desulfurococcaceae archaeon]